MPRPVKWARDLHLIREKATRSRTETWSRPDVEHLFGVGPSSAQTLMKAIGGIQTVGGTHFVDRNALQSFLDSMVAAPSVEAALQDRLARAEPPPKPKPLRVALPASLRNAMLPDLPATITLEPGRLEVRADTALAMLESLMALAMIMQNDLDRFQQVVELPRPVATDDDLRKLFSGLRDRASQIP